MAVSGGVITGAEWLVDDRRAYAEAHGLSPRVGAPYRAASAPWRKVWHTVEALPRTVGAARNTAVTHRTPPHLWAHPGLDWVGQTVPLNLSAYALRHEAGDPETNHAHAVQTEVFGFASGDMLRDPGIARWLGERVLGPVLAAGVPLVLAHVAPSDGSDAYGLNGSVRMSWSAWAGFDGQCGHQNVPGNSHWDPGRADYGAIARAALIEDGGFMAALSETEQRQLYDHVMRVPEGANIGLLFAEALRVAIGHTGGDFPDGEDGHAARQLRARVIEGVSIALDDPDVQDKLRAILGAAP